MQVQSQDVTCHLFAGLFWSDDQSGKRKHAYSVLRILMLWSSVVVITVCFFFHQDGGCR